MTVSGGASKPTALLLAGPNGAGKTTSSRLLIPPGIDFVNADEISRRLAEAGHPVAGREVAAGRIVLAEMARLESARASFCVETNLAGRGFLRWIARWEMAGYHLRLLFIALPSADAALGRVADRVALGGHDVPPDVVRRRWRQGLRAFFDVYRHVVSDWDLLDNSDTEPVFVARRRGEPEPTVFVQSVWSHLEAAGGAGEPI